MSYSHLLTAVIRRVRRIMGFFSVLFFILPSMSVIGEAVVQPLDFFFYTISVGSLFLCIFYRFI